MSTTTADNRPVYQAACHCGTVRFTVRLSDGLNTVRRCNCSYCRMRGAVTVSANLAWALALRGNNWVGLLDADLHGPTIPLMMGLKNERAQSHDNKILPVTVMSRPSTRIDKGSFGCGAPVRDSPTH